MKQFLISYTRNGSDMIATVNAETADQASAYFLSVKADAQIIDCREDSTNYTRRGVPSYTVPEGWTAEPEEPACVPSCNYEIVFNKQFGSHEIYFSEKPADEVREALKALHFRWNGKKSCWYGFADEETISAAIGDASDNWQPIEGAVNAPVGYHWENNGKSRFSGEYKHRLAKDEAAPAPHVVNKYGVKVGDIFRCSWGWEQTNEDFFQVVSLSGASSVRVRQVALPLRTEEAVSFMAGNYSFDLPQAGEILPAINSIFIHDPEKGDLHRLIDDGNGSAFFKLEGRYYCRPYHGGTVYISWYA